MNNTPVDRPFIATIEARNTATHEVCAVYDMENQRGKYYLLHVSDPQTGAASQIIAIHVSVLDKLADLFHSLALKETEPK